jgi:uncharacterized protein
MHDFTFGGHQWQAMADRALFWPTRRALIVADLHFEKASWYARSGQYLPPFDSEATLARLTALAERTSAAELWCLGDNFHDADGPERLSDAAHVMLEALAGRLRLVWITGNHDADAAFAGESHAEIEVDGVILRHEAEAGETRPELSGHFHPKIRVATAARSISRPCFVIGGNRLLLPAFGALTGGLDARDPALARFHQPGARALVATERALLQLPLVGQRPVARQRRNNAGRPTSVTGMSQ